MKLFARVLATIVDDLTARFDEEAKENLVTSLEDLTDLGERIARGYEDAAARGDAMLVRFSRYL